MTVNQERAGFFRSFWIVFLLSATTLFSSSCLRNNEEKLSRILAEGDTAPRKFRLQEIQERGRLIAIADYNPTDYFLYRGEMMGYQYERLKNFADYLGVELEIRVISDLNKAFDLLNHGKADLVAMGLTITQERSKKVAFAEPIYHTRQMLVQRKPDNWRKMRTWDDIEKTLVRNPLYLAEKTIHVQAGSVYEMRLRNLSSEIGSKITVKADDERSVEELIDAVAIGEIDYTVCDEMLVKLYEKVYPDLDIKTPLSFPQYIAWAVKKDSDSLRMAINYWQMEFSQQPVAAYLFDKYYNNPSLGYSAKSEFLSFNGSRISRYDGLMKEISEDYGLDWRLLASLIYQESQFHPGALALSGAFGLMQMMPGTAALYGIDSTSSPEEQIKAGVMYLKALDEALPESISGPEERMKFMLASYNMGIAHVLDARRLAEKNGKNPDIWSANVDYYILNKSNPKYYQDTVVKFGYARGEETYNFVLEVLERYEHYKNVVLD
jgi:membrane-bound lytic murein transglycosylase F